MSSEKIKKILEWLKVELESNFEVESSTIKQLLKAMPGNFGDYLDFGSKSGLYVDIQFWDTGFIEIIAANLETKTDYIDLYHFVPEDLENKYYPPESEEAFVKKINELLVKLYNENPNIKTSLPDIL